MSQLHEESLEELQDQFARLQQRIQVKKLEEAQALSRSSSQQHVSLAACPQYRPQNGLSMNKSTPMGRSKSNMGHPTPLGGAMTNSPSAPDHQAHKRQRRAFSQQSHATLPMNRNESNRSEPSMPFVQAGGPIAPLITPASGRCSREDLASHHLPSVQENRVLPDVGMNPGEYVRQNYSYLDTTRPNLSPQDAYANPAPSDCPSMYSGSSGAEGPAALSRESSLFDPFSGQMLRLPSSQSCLTDPFPGADAVAPSLSQQSFSQGKTPASDQALLGLGLDSTPLLPGQYGSSTAVPNMSLSPESAIMERTDSNSSIDSTKSTASKSGQRFKKASERVRQASKATLAPKPHEQSPTSTKAASAKQESKMAVPNKSRYQRPRHPKVYCKQCDKHPEGFRGDHELRRHINAKHHGGFVKKFVCRDPATVGLASNVQVRHPLSKCKACLAGKEYGAYYNAAAHLRRTHFKPKGPRAKRGADDEKRGGIGGGDWPSMADLKLWFEEKFVQDDPDVSLTDDIDDMTQESLYDPPADGLADAVNDMSPFDVDANFAMAFNGAADRTSFDGADAPILSFAGSFDYPSYEGTPQMSGPLANYGLVPPDGLPTGASPNVMPSASRDTNPLAIDTKLWDDIQIA